MTDGISKACDVLRLVQCSETNCCGQAFSACADERCHGKGAGRCQIMRAEQDLFMLDGVPDCLAKHCADSGAKTEQQLRIRTRLRITTAPHSRPAPQTESTADGEANQGSFCRARVAFG